jgi:hypothetical protein
MRDSVCAGPGATPAPPSAARTGSRTGFNPTPGGSVMGTPAFAAGSQQPAGSAPGTGRRSSAGLTPRVDLGFYAGYLGFHQNLNSAGRRSSLAPSVRAC